MNLLSRLWLLTRAFFRDLADEADPQRPALPEGWLTDASDQLVTLRAELGEAIAREKRLELQWHAEQNRTHELESAVEAALRAEDEATAQARLEQAQWHQARATELGELYAACREVTQRLHIAVETQQARLAEMNQQANALIIREHNAGILERLHQHRQADGRSQDNFTEQAARLTRREDVIQVREELKSQKK